MMKTPKRHTDLRDWRLSLDISQREAADKLGISLTTYSRLERGVRAVKGEMARFLMDKTGVPIEVLAGVAR